jgi:hypothetical protein
MLLDRGGAGQRRGIEPGRHRDNHHRAEAHAAEQQAAARHVLHMRQEAHEEGPERVDSDRDRDRIDDGGEEHDGRIAIQKVAHAEIGVDAAGERQHAKRNARRHFETAHPIAQAADMMDPFRRRRRRPDVPAPHGIIRRKFRRQCGSAPCKPPRQTLAFQELAFQEEKISAKRFFTVAACALT